MEETFKESVIEKITQLEKEIKYLSGKSATMEEITGKENILAEGIDEFKSVLTQLNKNALGVLSGYNLIKEVSGKMEHYTRILENPVERKEHHIHHFRWPLGVAIGVFLLLVLSLSALYLNHQKLNQYMANDTKYRSLKLMDDKYLQHYLLLSDSLYQVNPDMRKEVKQIESERSRRMELLMQANEKQQEAEELKRKAGK
ncbi:MAG: hypothetical protein ACRDE2_01395 [Chitinophagaceae bacterium]